MDTFLEIALLIGVGFVAGIINTLAGGGSLLTLPVLIFLGLPPQIANGTNRIVILVQSLSGTFGFRSKGVKTAPFDWYLGFTATLGALVGAQIALEIEGALFNKILALIMLGVGLLILFQKQHNLPNKLPKLTGFNRYVSMLLFFFVGIYGGFINAGIGFVILLILTQLNDLSLVKANAVKVTVVTIYTVVALFFFSTHSAVAWEPGLWMASGSGLSAWLSSRWSVNRGDRFIRIFLFVMVVLLALKLWVDQ